MKALTLAAALLLPAGRTCLGAGFLVIAPDRGFLGNEEVRDAFAGFAARSPGPAALAFIDSDPAPSLKEGLEALARGSGGEIFVLPLFASSAQWRMKAAQASLERLPATGVALYLAPPFGEDPRALSALSAAAGPGSKTRALVAVSQGADPEGLALLRSQTEEAARKAALRGGFADSAAVALIEEEPLNNWWQPLAARLAPVLEGFKSRGLEPVVVVHDLAPKLDSMMSFSASCEAVARGRGGRLAGDDLGSRPAELAAWLLAQANRRLPVEPSGLGVIYMPHGADLRWNNLLLDSVAHLRSRYRFEPAFGMGDAAVLKRALSKVEASGLRAATVIRVFSLEDSFRAGIESILGLREPPPPGLSGHGMHGGPPPEPWGGSLSLDTVGGIEDDPFFAEALSDRAADLSKDPSRETVFLLAHGSGDDEENARWMRNLRSLGAALQERASARGKRFRAVRAGTWREDWPGKREAAVRAIRAAVSEASQDGDVIVVPARVAEGGPERKLLAGLRYAYDGRGFAPHPRFADWVEGRIRLSIGRLNAARYAGLTRLDSPALR